jgi:hypothetical protein
MDEADLGRGVPEELHDLLRFKLCDFACFCAD